MSGDLPSFLVVNGYLLGWGLCFVACAAAISYVFGFTKTVAKWLRRIITGKKPALRVSRRVLERLDQVNRWGDHR